MRVAHSISIALAAALILIAPMAVESLAQTRDGPPPPSEEEDEESEEAEPDEEAEPVPPGCIRIGETVSCPTPAADIAAELVANGPQLTAPRSERSFSVRGFIRDGWPIVVDFEPEPNTRTYVDIFPYEAAFLNFRRIRIFLDREGMGGRRLFHGRIELPAAGAGAGEVRVGDINLVSRRLREDGRMSRRRAPVRVHGIGAGPRAVGSISVAEVELAGGQTRLPMPTSRSVEYSYRLRQPFDLVRADLWRQCSGFLCRDHVASSELRQRSGPIRGNAPVRRPGTYRLNVRAWLSCPTSDFQKCADDAAWATGRAGPLVVVE